ncbi:MAG: hypothetical protein NZT61_04870 [Deltaproteobacteria bacterium]|nr:hypothetical protein [Deltaproteobacteria bacterium]MCX7953050.1 hypothetical protein [Deltaproteobacteria bacterium]
MEIFFVTSNDMKLNEARYVIPTIRKLEIKLNEIQSLDQHDIVANKIQQAKSEFGNRCILVDDTALYLEAFNYQLPGPFVSWFLKTIGTAGIFQIAEKFQQFGCIAKTVLGFWSPEAGLHFFEGESKGKLVFPKVNSSTSWDPVFCPEGTSKTFFEMSIDEKRQFSMREKALVDLAKFLRC